MLFRCDLVQSMKVLLTRVAAGVFQSMLLSIILS